MKNVLVFSCGAIPAIDINFALRGNDEYRLYGGSSYDDHGIYVYENYIGNMPYTYQEDFIPKLNEILDTHKIDFIIPLHETMILTMQEHVDEIHAKVISSCYETALLCRYKSKTYAALKGLDFVPKTYSIESVDRYPIFVKKDDDQGARHAYRVDNYDELKLYASQENMIICEYLPGEEVTVDCFTDRHGKLCLCNPRVADRMLAGIDVHARRIMDEPDILRIAELLNQHIKFRGPWFFQIKKDAEGKFKLLEIATRFAGAFSLTRCMDINTPLMAIRDFDDKDVDFCFNDLPIEADKMFIGRYSIFFDYETVYVDGKTALFNDGVINPMMMMFLAQCKNQKKKIIYVSDSAENDLSQLYQYGIAPSMFNSTVHSQELLDGEKAVLVSRNESLRNRLRRTSAFICYDPTAIEVLLDWHG